MATKITGISNAVSGWDGKLLSELVEKHNRIIHICRDDARMDDLEGYVRFFAPGLEILKIPAWDCLPYDRVSPNSGITSQRCFALSRIAELDAAHTCLILITVNAYLQRLPPLSFFKGMSINLKLNKSYPLSELLLTLENGGYFRTDTVREAGEFAVRGGIIDIYPAGRDEPLRLDFFGDELESVKRFDPITQRSIDSIEFAKLSPVAEIILNSESINRFKSSYREAFGAKASNDQIYQTIAEGRYYVGMEHWLPFFYNRLDTLEVYAKSNFVSLDSEVEAVAQTRFELINEYFEARSSLANSTAVDDMAVYRPLTPNSLYITPEEWSKKDEKFNVIQFHPLNLILPSDSNNILIDSNIAPGIDLTEIRQRQVSNVYDELIKKIQKTQANGKKVLICAFSHGSAERIEKILLEQSELMVEAVHNYKEVSLLSMDKIGIAILPIDKGFDSPDVLFVSEPDILGERLARPSKRRKKRGEDFLREVSALSDGDFVVHLEHGIGQFKKLETLEIGGAPHDCLTIEYSGGDKLFLPVENIDVLTRYGSEDSGAVVDKLGGIAWQSRKARVKKRLKDMADQLIRTAAERELQITEKIEVPSLSYEAFCSRFKYNETEDQLKSISDTLQDLARGRPMDRLICGDVGFGKTEVALRAAMVAASQGLQVAIVVPTTLLCRQHYQLFSERFSGTPIKVRQLSRLLTSQELSEVKSEVNSGECNIVIGTHALLGKSIEFSNLGLLIIDEEQHFGVAQKEKLKQIRGDIHVLTLTATPIPRTLQLAMSGVRDLSLIASPPVDRLAIRTFIMPYDGLVIREAIQRERHRGGQAFYVCPRIEDLSRVYDRLIKLIPDLKIASAHGRMVPSDLEDIMAAFCDGSYDVLLSTHIIESGLDIPNANTIIIHNSDKFGLAQLYQLRGRVGRSKTRAYAYLTTHPTKQLTPNAKKRLGVMQTLDSLGAGFSLASHDMDIRGAGNLLGEEQSGQVREVGIELYQHMLKEAVLAARDKEKMDETSDNEWTPQISIGNPVLIPDSFIPDLNVRLSIYRRIADLQGTDEIDSFAAELSDRFGRLPAEVNNLFQVILLKNLCRSANVEKIDAGPKGAVIAFRNDSVKNLEGLLNLLEKEKNTAHIRTDHKLVYKRNWQKSSDRVNGLTRIMRDLAAIAA